MKPILLLFLAAISLQASAKLWFWRNGCESYLRNETVDMRASEITDASFFEDGLGLYENADLDIRRGPNGKLSMRVGASLYRDGEEFAEIEETEIGIFLLTFRGELSVKIVVHGDLATGYVYDNRAWHQFAKFTR